MEAVLALSLAPLPVYFKDYNSSKTICKDFAKVCVSVCVCLCVCLCVCACLCAHVFLSPTHPSCPKLHGWFRAFAGMIDETIGRWLVHHSISIPCPPRRCCKFQPTNHGLVPLATSPLLKLSRGFPCVCGVGLHLINMNSALVERGFLGVTKEALLTLSLGKFYAFKKLLCRRHGQRHICISFYCTIP